LTLETLDDLRGFVRHVICERECLAPEAFRFSEQTLMRNGKPCGLHFTLLGPRSVRPTAIWDAICHTVLFYDCSGQRFHRTELPKPSQLHFELATFAGCETETVSSS
jgi:hypothetical protein